jgi:hypothetical protein
LIWFHHCSTSIFICPLVNLLKKSIEGCITLWFIIFKIFFELLVYLVPIFVWSVWFSFFTKILLHFWHLSWSLDSSLIWLKTKPILPFFWLFKFNF